MWPVPFRPSREDLLPFSRFRESMDRLFDEFMEGPGFPLKREGNGRMSLPPVDVKETDEALIVETEMPGLDLKDITVQLEGDLLLVRGERRQEHEEKPRTFHRQECGFGVFERQVRLPAEVDRDQVDATYARGILKVTLPKKAGARPKSVTVKVKES